MFIVITLAAFFASLLTLFSGFGLGTLLMPVVAIFFPLVVAVALTALVHLLNNLFKLATLWRDVNGSIAVRFGIPALLATIPGAWLLTRLAVFPDLFSYQIAGYQALITPIKLAVGILLLVFALVEWRGLAKKVSIPARYLPWGGLLSGFFGGLSGHQGAFRSAFLLHAGLDARQFVATNAAIATLVDISRLAVYGLNLSLLAAEVNITLVFIASLAAFAGVLAGKAGLHKVTIALVQKLVAVMLLLLGLLITAGII
ncbi:MAG: TSUP family transporter [Pseudohongiellaceae bacterium]